MVKRTHGTLVSELKRIAQRLDEAPTKTYMNYNAKFPAEDYVEHFGSWRGALAAADVSIPISYEKVGDRALISHMRRVADEIARPPSASEYHDLESIALEPVVIGLESGIM